MYFYHASEESNERYIYYETLPAVVVYLSRPINQGRK